MNPEICAKKLSLVANIADSGQVTTDALLLHITADTVLKLQNEPPSCHAVDNF